MDPGLCILIGAVGDAHLREARVVELDEAVAHVATVAEHGLSSGAELEVHYYRGSRFLRRAAKLVEVEGRRLTIALGADEAAAEARECYRVAVPMDTLTALFDGRVSESLQDLSAEGLSIRTREPFAVGGVHRVQIRGTGRPIEGVVEVRAVRELARGWRRVGFAVREPEGRLGVELGRVSADLQRRVLAVQRG